MFFKSLNFYVPFRVANQSMYIDATKTIFESSLDFYKTIQQIVDKHNKMMGRECTIYCPAALLTRLKLCCNLGKHVRGLFQRIKQERS